MLGSGERERKEVEGGRGCRRTSPRALGRLSEQVGVEWSEGSDKDKGNEQEEVTAKTRGNLLSLGELAGVCDEFARVWKLLRCPLRGHQR